MQKKVFDAYNGHLTHDSSEEDLLYKLHWMKESDLYYAFRMDL